VCSTDSTIQRVQLGEEELERIYRGFVSAIHFRQDAPRRKEKLIRILIAQLPQFPLQCPAFIMVQGSSKWKLTRTLP
jgi:hypothetical protein